MKGVHFSNRPIGLVYFSLLTWLGVVAPNQATLQGCGRGSSNATRKNVPARPATLRASTWRAHPIFYMPSSYRNHQNDAEYPQIRCSARSGKRRLSEVEHKAVRSVANYLAVRMRDGIHTRRSQRPV